MSAVESPFEVVVYDKNLQRIGWLGDPLSIVATPRHNEQPSASITVPADHRLARALATPGTRVVVLYQDEQEVAGPVHLIEAGRGQAGVATRTMHVRDDWSIFGRLLGWPNPAGDINAQGDDGTHDVRTGPAETVLKGFLSANLARIGAGAHHLPVTIAPDQGRGATVTVQARMQPLRDRLFPVVDQAGIGVTVRQTLTGLVVDCYEPVDFPLVLSEDGGSLIGNEWSLRAPEVTRVIVGADGQGDSRVFRGPFVNTTAETTYRTVSETFVDARDLKSTDPNFTALVQARANEVLAEGAARSGLSVRLAETDVFRYGGPLGVRVGDRVPVELEPETDTEAAVVITDVLRSATLTWSAAGVNVTPLVGDRVDDPEQTLARALAAVARRQRNHLAGD